MRTRTAGLLLVLLSGCSTSGPTPYVPAGEESDLGYSESEASPDALRVRFKGDAPHDSREKAEDFTLLRSAELTLEKGYRHFVILKYQDTTIFGDKDYESDPGFEFTIKMLSKRPTIEEEESIGQRYGIPHEDLFVYDAVYVERELRRKYDLD